jgi:hypothetical protein
MGLEQQIRRNRLLHFLGRAVGEARLRMGTDIGVGPAVEGALLHLREIIRHHAIAEAASLLHHRIEIAGLGWNVKVLPERLRALIQRSNVLQSRVRRLDATIHATIPTRSNRGNPVERQFGLLKAAFERELSPERFPAKWGALPASRWNRTNWRQSKSRTSDDCFHADNPATRSY